MIRRFPTPLALTLLTLTLPTLDLHAQADEAAEPMPALICGGAVPSWDLRITGDRAVYAAPELQSALSFDIPHRSIAEGRAWPRALSLIGPRDTAVAVIDQNQCVAPGSGRSFPFTAHLLTQRAGEAILLTGCCRPAPVE